MPQLYWKKHTFGLPPGSLVSDGTSPEFPTRIHVFNYSKDSVDETGVEKVEDVFACRDTDEISWINIDGRDIKVIETIDDYFGVHPLVLEDIVSTGQRPKVEDYGAYLFLVLKMIYFDDKTDDLYSEQIGLVLAPNYVISFQEKPGDLFDPIRDRLRTAKGRVRQAGSDYLMYCLIDAIVDNYFVLLERIGEKIDQLEKILMKDPHPKIPHRVHLLKRKIIFLRKQIWPLREVIGLLMRLETGLIVPDTKLYLRDVYDHCTRVNDSIETFRDALSGLHDIYLSSVSNKMNEVMKVLTMFAAVFIPLTFIAGIYGMNFEYMPELRWRHGYFIVLGFMAFVTAGMIYFFRKNRWL